MPPKNIEEGNSLKWEVVDLTLDFFFFFFSLKCFWDIHVDCCPQSDGAKAEWYGYKSSLITLI